MKKPTQAEFRKLLRELLEAARADETAGAGSPEDRVHAQLLYKETHLRMQAAIKVLYAKES